MNVITGKVWKFGDNIDTDLIIPARYLNTSDPHELAKHVMEDADPEFPRQTLLTDTVSIQTLTADTVKRQMEC